MIRITFLASICAASALAAPAFAATPANGAAAPALAPPAAPAAPAARGPVKFAAHYAIGVTIDPSRSEKVSALVKATKGAMSMVGGAVPAGTVDDIVSISADKYSIASRTRANRVVAAALGGDLLTRQSEGAVDAGGYIASEKFTEVRGAKRRFAVTTDYDKRQTSYLFNGKTVRQEPAQYRIADTASLPYLFLGQALPGGPFTVAVTDGRKLRQMAFEPSDDMVAIGKQNVAALHLTRTRLEGSDPAVELWLRKDDGMPLRIRVGFDKKYGIVLDQKLAELPPVLK